MASFKIPGKFIDTKAMPSLMMLASIGRLAILTGSIEDILHAIIWHYLEIDDLQGVVLTSDKSMKRLCEDVIKLSKVHRGSTSAMRDDMADIITSLNKTSQVRNRCVHWMWHDPDDEGKHKLSPPSYKSKAADEYYTVEQIEKIVQELTIIENRLLPHQLSTNEIYRDVRLGDIHPAFVPWLNVLPQPERGSAA